MTSQAPGVVILKPFTVNLSVLRSELVAGVFGGDGTLVGAAIARIADLCCYIPQISLASSHTLHEKNNSC